ncbi:tetratricopeptide repeat protein [Bacteroidota bacterium]
MRFLIIAILITLLPDDLNEISRINRLKREAAKAYKEEAYDQAVNKYRTLIDSIGVDDDRVLLNLSNAYYRQKDTSNAIPYYQQLLNSDQNDIRSIAHQQMGVISNDQQKYDEALTYFKNAIKSDPSNEDARYNYELLKKLMQEQQQQQQNQDQDQQNQDNKDQQDQQNQDQQQQQDQQNQEQNEDIYRSHRGR